MNLDLKNKVFCVTCAGSGVGKACVETLLNEEAIIIAITRTSEKLFELKDLYPKSLFILEVDITDSNLMLEKLNSLIFQLNLNPVGLIFVPVREPNLSFDNINYQVVDKAFDNNLQSLMCLIDIILPFMKNERFGRVISILGASTLYPLIDHVPANLSRISIVSLLSSFGREFININITANSILMGPFDTPGINSVWTERAKSQSISFTELSKIALNKVPAKRLGKVEECSYLCAFLCSQYSGFMTGQSILIDGGANLTI